MKFFDAHCHLLDARYGARLPLVVGRACASGVEQMLCCGCEQADWSGVRRLAEAFGPVVPSFGLHPLRVAARTPSWLQELHALLSEVPAAVGEIGLDFSGNLHNFADQEAVFAEQLRLARELRRPVVIHCRHAWGRLMSVLKAEGGIPGGGLIHSYSGSPELVPQIERANLCISFSGAITYAGNRRGRESVRRVSRDRLLIETDSPDLSPAGAPRLNEPANVVQVARATSELRGESLDSVAGTTTAIAARLMYFLPGRPDPSGGDGAGA